jgi:hypothetical protein
VRWGWRELNPRRPSQNVTGHRFRLNNSAKEAVPGTGMLRIRARRRVRPVVTSVLPLSSTVSSSWLQPPFPYPRRYLTDTRLLTTGPGHAARDLASREAEASRRRSVDGAGRGYAE